MEKQKVTITKNEALSLFCFQKINPISVLREKQNLLTNENHELVITDLRGMALIVKILANYKSEEVRYIIQNLYAQFFNEIYKDENRVLPFCNFIFMISVLFRYRNIKDYRLIRTITFENKFIETVKENLLSLNAIKTYQKVLF